LGRDGNGRRSNHRGFDRHPSGMSKEIAVTRIA
jgi:hypothetical protein